MFLIMFIYEYASALDIIIYYIVYLLNRQKQQQQTSESHRTIYRQINTRFYHPQYIHCYYYKQSLDF